MLSKAKAEAARKAKAATAAFRVSLLQLTATAKRQETKLNERVNSLAGVVEKNRLAQAKVNRRLSAEMKRIVRIGAQREARRLGRDRRLRGLIAKKQARGNEQNSPHKGVIQQWIEQTSEICKEE